MSMFVKTLNLGGAGPAVAIKDSIDVAGVPTQAGSQALADAAPAAGHAEVVERLLSAGYRITGKVTMHELAFGTTGINAWAGTPVNPRFPDLVPGGSSSGSAAAVAAGVVDVALGSDTGGSIRIPAACCGVFGFKPSFGRVSRQGVMPALTSLDCVGPFAADMDSLIACMRAIDPSFGALPGLEEVSIGLVDVPAVAEIRQAVAGAVAGSGLPAGTVRFAHFDAAYQAGLVIINAETWAACGHLVETGKVGADVAQRLVAASRTTSADVDAANAVRDAFTAEVDAALARFPVLALPTMADAPPSLDQAADTSRLVSMTSLVRPFNLSGHPAIAIPLPARSGFPVSLQLVAARGHDELLCAVARHVASRLQ